MSDENPSTQPPLLVYRRGHGPGLTSVSPVWDERSLKAAGLSS